MTFTSTNFVVFLAATFAIYYSIGVSGSIQLAILVLASAIFYAWDNPELLMLLSAVGLLAGFASFALDRIVVAQTRIIIAATTIGAMLAVLGFFKYSGLFYETLVGAGQMPQWERFFLGIPLPIGISFYIFHSISLLVDVYRRQYRVAPEIGPRAHLLRTGLYILFFPQLIAGPITKARNFYPQIEKKRLSQVDWPLVLHSLILGYFLKLVIADNLAVETQIMGFPHYVGAPGILLLTLLLGYSCQIFSDFFGYSLMAIGLAALFGYRLPDNFNRPYIADSFSDFWRRWHITLSAWLRDYLYIPLGGSQKGSVRTYANLFIVMFLGGLWHGAAWSFAIWGTLHGVALAVERPFLNTSFYRSNSQVLIALRIMLVFSVVTIAWLFFRLEDYSQAFSYLFYTFSGIAQSFPRSTVAITLAYCLPVLLFHAVPMARGLLQKGAIRMWAYVVMLFLIVTNAGVPGAFIYFRF